MAMMRLQRVIVLLALLVVVFAATPAFGSAIIGRNVTRPTLTIDRQGRAHVSYDLGGRRETLVAGGAINARKPSKTEPQVKFQIRYGEGGRGVCLPYDGPRLAWLVKACKAADGSYWALQSWQRLKPNYGGTKGAWELPDQSGHARRRRERRDGRALSPMERGVRAGRDHGQGPGQGREAPRSARRCRGIDHRSTLARHLARQ